MGKVGPWTLEEGPRDLRGWDPGDAGFNGNLNDQNNGIFIIAISYKDMSPPYTRFLVRISKFQPRRSFFLFLYCFLNVFYYFHVTTVVQN